MSDPTSTSTDTTDAKASETRASQTGASTAAPDSAGERADAGIEAEMVEPVVDRTAELEAAVADLRDRLLRTAAEMENLRRRTEREVQDARRYAVAAFARDMLSVADNLRRALEAAAAPVDAAPGETKLPALVEGVELTERELLKALEKSGVRKLEPKGQLFDPNFHQAIFEAPDVSVPSGTVVQVVQEGYVIGDRILRPAMVGVARGGQKPSSATGAESSQPGVDRTA